MHVVLYNIAPPSSTSPLVICLYAYSYMPSIQHTSSALCARDSPPCGVVGMRMYNN